ncbi:hypothetical protein SAMN04488038_110167 [Solimonas aquatica]|uniref:Large extracellular alpha-helical protein n=2 Tax=Solimonas aquatica TaxID=489703 RepID=A0A1H9ISK9_9GAMM|nr:hypothetical protein SAMN04488038_110167 [Solimonas aquatica]
MPCGALLLAAALGGVAQAGELKLLRITPSGEDVPVGNQLLLSFDRAMVPLGRMERQASEIPVRITPELPCQWRWLDVQTLACNLADGAQLGLATRYQLRIDAGFTALDGSRLERGIEHRFSTETPTLQWAEVAQWTSPVRPQLRVRFSQPVARASVEQALSLDGAALQASGAYEDEDTPFYTPQGEARELWLLTPRQALRADQAYALRLRPGLRSAFGDEPGRESREVSKLQTYAAPRLLGLQCFDGKAQRQIKAGEHCTPLEGAALLFNVPMREDAAALQLSPQSPALAPAAQDEGELTPATPVNGEHEAGQVYALRLPYRLAAETDYQLRIAASLQDRFGRTLGSEQHLQFRTGARQPRLVLDHSPAVLESGVDSQLPVYVTNLDQLDTQFRAQDAQGLHEQGQQRTLVPPVRNLSFALPLDVRSMLGARSGALQGQLRSTPATDDKPKAFFAEVTPWQVQAKLGNHNLLVWITGMADGKPVSGAEVEVLDGFAAAPRAQARSDAQGLALLPGSAALDARLERQYVSVSDDKREPLYLRVRRGTDLALLPLSYEFQVDTWRASREQISEWRRQRHGHLRAWGSTAQGVYRAGDRLQYKLYVREDSGRTLEPAPAGAYTLRLIDPAGNPVEERAHLKLSDFGALDGSYTLPRSAAVGWYRFELQPEFVQDLRLEPMRVLVSDFVPAPFRVQAELQAREAQPAQRIRAELRAQLHGGGPFANAPARVVARLEAGALEPQDPLARRYQFDSWQSGGRAQSAVLDQQLHLDAQGQWRGEVEVKEAPVLVGSLQLEGSVQDDQGRMIVASAQIPYHGRDRYIGIAQQGWLQAGKPGEVQTLVVDAAGKPLSRVPYYVKIERKITKGARVKSAGNAYITRSFSQWQRVASCQGRSSAQGNVCRFTPDGGGELRAIALVRDSQNRLHESSTWMYAQGANEILWEDSPDFSLDVRPDAAQYQVGDTAKLFVKNPYPGAQALITVERYGVLEQRVQVLRGATPVIELPIKPEYLPGAYVSVTVMSPRVQAPIKDGVDLGKPAFRMGYTTLKVQDPYRELLVQVTPDASTLKPRQSLQVALRATARHASDEPVEFAVAVLDEAVFDLIRGGGDYFDPLKGFTQLDPLDLANYSLLTRLVGRQKFEKKGASAGGDGGADLSLRSVEKFVAYWNPSLKADARGSARFSFITPDNLSGWRVLAMAVTPSDRMGLGQAQIAVSKPTELRAALPAQLQRGDRLDASFTLMNREPGTRTLKVKLQASGAASAQREQSVSLKPFERRTLTLPLSIERSGSVQLTARAGDAQDEDALRVQIPVRERAANIVAADFASLTAGESYSLAIKPPPQATQLALQLDVAGSLLGNLGGAFEHMAAYPYDCWEQRLSKALMAAYYLKLRAQLPATLAWPQAEALPAQLFEDAASFQAPGGGMGFYVAEDRYQSPYLSAYTALVFAWLQQLGYPPPAAVWDKLDAYLKVQLRQDIAAPGYEHAETRAQLRAVVLAALAQHGQLDAAELRRYLPLLPRMGLFGETMLADAAAHTKGAEAVSEAAWQRLLARGQQSAANLLLRADEQDDNPWLLGSPLRANCAALSALAARHAPGEDELAAKLARAITQARGTRLWWRNTQEDLYCTRAIVDYARVYESAPLALSVRAQLGAQTLGTAQLSGGQPQARWQQAIGEQAQTLKLDTQGSGRAYASSALRYAAPPPTQPLQAGLAVRRQYYVWRAQQWQALQGPQLEVKQGEQLKIEISLDVPAFMTQLLVDDPVPAGLEPINPDLATASGFDAEALAQASPAYPYPFYHRQLRFDAVRFFAEQADAGHYRLAYLARAVASGEFAVNEIHAERLYEPDVRAEGVAQRLTVQAQ